MQSVYHAERLHGFTGANASPFTSIQVGLLLNSRKEKGGGSVGRKELE